MFFSAHFSISSVIKMAKKALSGKEKEKKGKRNQQKHLMNLVYSKQFLTAKFNFKINSEFSQGRGCMNNSQVIITKC